MPASDWVVDSRHGRTPQISSNVQLAYKMPCRNDTANDGWPREEFIATPQTGKNSKTSDRGVAAGGLRRYPIQVVDSTITGKPQKAALPQSSSILCSSIKSLKLTPA